MKKVILSSLLILTIVVGCNADPSSEAELRAFESRLATAKSTDLPDFANEMFKSVKAKAAELRKIFERDGRVAPEMLRAAAFELDRFNRLALQRKRILGRAYAQRNLALQLGFTRSANSALLYRAEHSYRESLRHLNDGRIENARQQAERAARQFDSLIRTAKAREQHRLTGLLQNYRQSMSTDLAALSAAGTDSGQLQSLDGVSARVRIERPGMDLDGDGVIEPFPYWPPPPPPLGPRPTMTIEFDRRSENSVRIRWLDVSDNETGSRVLRSTDLTNWQVVHTIGAIPRITMAEFTDSGLTADTKYWYIIETFNVEGARRSPVKGVMTRMPRVCFTVNNVQHCKDLDVWRLQLRIKVADFSGAGSDLPLWVSFDDNGETLGSIATLVDYGHDDFQRGSEFTYDLNFDRISTLGDINGINISTSGFGDSVRVESLALLVNNHEIFDRDFGGTPSSALDLGAGTPYRVEHGELRNHPSWQSYVGSSRSDLTFGLPPIDFGEADGTFKFVIPPEEVVSRIEGFVGHMLLVDREIKSRFRWGHVDGPAVEVSRVSEDTLHVDLDTEAIVNNWPNPALDIDFDVTFKTTCDNAQRKLTVNMTSKNFKSNADFATWKDIASLGVIKLSDKLIDWYAGNCTTPPDINQSIEIPMQTNCTGVTVKVTPNGGLEICCLRLQ